MRSLYEHTHRNQIESVTPCLFIASIRYLFSQLLKCRLRISSRDKRRIARTPMLFSPRDEARLYDLACARQLSEKAESVFDGFEELSSKPDRRENIIGELHLNHLQR
jgi:hypothetical protein